MKAEPMIMFVAVATLALLFASIGKAIDNQVRFNAIYSEERH